jgi:Tub family
LAAFEERQQKDIVSKKTKKTNVAAGPVPTADLGQNNNRFNKMAKKQVDENKASKDAAAHPEFDGLIMPAETFSRVSVDQPRQTTQKDSLTGDLEILNFLHRKQQIEALSTQQAPLVEAKEELIVEAVQTSRASTAAIVLSAKDTNTVNVRSAVTRESELKPPVSASNSLKVLSTTTPKALTTSLKSPDSKPSLVQSNWVDSDNNLSSANNLTVKLNRNENLVSVDMLPQNKAELIVPEIPHPSAIVPPPKALSEEKLKPEDNPAIQLNYVALNDDAEIKVTPVAQTAKAEVEIKKPEDAKKDQNLSKIPSLEVSNVFTRCSKNTILRCKIHRKKNLRDGNNPTYLLHNEIGNKFLLSAKKRMMSKTVNYIISDHPDDISKDSIHYLAKLKYNILTIDRIISELVSSSAIAAHLHPPLKFAV